MPGQTLRALPPCPSSAPTLPPPPGVPPFLCDGLEGVTESLGLLRDEQVRQGHLLDHILLLLERINAGS